MTANKPTQAPWIQTVSGKKFLLLNPDPDAIDIKDIAHALSMTVRFNGHCTEFYSVAEHSVHISRIVPPEFALWGLLHDASEAYLGDIPTPLKKKLRSYKCVEKRLMDVIMTKFGLPTEEPPQVKYADKAMLQAERQVIMVPPPEPWPIDFEGIKPADASVIQCWSPNVARKKFLERFASLDRLR